MRLYARTGCAPAMMRHDAHCVRTGTLPQPAGADLQEGAAGVHA